jgi:hypothetical protein
MYGRIRGSIAAIASLVTCSATATFAAISIPLSVLYALYAKATGSGAAPK